MSESTATQDLFPNVAFAHIVSLGANCEVAHQLRLNGRHSLHAPFDWLVTPLDALAHIFDEAGARLGSTFVAAKDGTSVRCGAYDVLYHHEFPRTDGNFVCFDAEAIAACRAKMAHKWLNLKRVCTGDAPVLFLRFWGETDLIWDRLGPGKEQLCSTDLTTLVVAITRRFPGLNFRLLMLLPCPGEMPYLAEPPDPRVAVEIISRGQNGDWAATDADWRAVFGRLRFQGAPVDRGLGETLHWSGEGEPPNEDLLREASDRVSRQAKSDVQASIHRRETSTVACLSMHKTGSTALTAALTKAGFSGVLHGHFAGPKSLVMWEKNRPRSASQPVPPSPGAALAARFADPSCSFTLVTCLRDPIAQFISTYFQRISTQHSENRVAIPVTNEAFVIWVDRVVPHSYPTWWFDDNFRTTLSFDFRCHPFNRKRRSTRFASDRLRLLILRHEDPTPIKEAELGWLMGCNQIALPRANVTAEKAEGTAYANFLARFKAPSRWIDELYNDDAIRHFYTPEEREHFRMRWSGLRT